jgi:hypothetical protein
MSAKKVSQKSVYPEKKPANPTEMGWQADREG